MTNSFEDFEFEDFEPITLQEGYEKPKTVMLKEYLEALKAKREAVGGDAPIIYEHDSGCQGVVYTPTLVFLRKGFEVARRLTFDDIVEDVTKRDDYNISYKLNQPVPSEMQIAIIIN